MTSETQQHHLLLTLEESLAAELLKEKAKGHSSLKDWCCVGTILHASLVWHEIWIFKSSKALSFSTAP